MVERHFVNRNHLRQFLVPQTFSTTGEARQFSTPLAKAFREFRVSICHVVVLIKMNLCIQELGGYDLCASMAAHTSSTRR